MDTFGGGGLWNWKKKEKGDLSENHICTVWFVTANIDSFTLKKSNKIIKSYRHEQTFLLPKEISLDEEWGDLITP